MAPPPLLTSTTPEKDLKVLERAERILLVNDECKDDVPCTPSFGISGLGTTSETITSVNEAFLDENGLISNNKSDHSLKEVSNSEPVNCTFSAIDVSTSNDAVMSTVSCSTTFVTAPVSQRSPTTVSVLDTTVSVSTVSSPVVTTSQLDTGVVHTGRHMLLLL